MSRLPSGQHREREVDGLAADRRFVANLDAAAHRRTPPDTSARGAALCHAVTSATTASVTVLIRSGETSTAYISARKP